MNMNKLFNDLYSLVPVIALQPLYWVLEIATMIMFVIPIVPVHHKQIINKTTTDYGDKEWKVISHRFWSLLG